MASAIYEAIIKIDHARLNFDSLRYSQEQINDFTFIYDTLSEKSDEFNTPSHKLFKKVDLHFYINTLNTFSARLESDGEIQKVTNELIDYLLKGY